ncbi:MAG: type II toxin-antitoxin system RelE/ParE family toxin [Rhodospirillaceae bacterium]|nr:type II toxin-antitoxin system RelE/ParE family toxin [Rhodospirillaceae bacterium]
MKLRWTHKGLSDLTRLHEFLAAADPKAAARSIQTLTAAIGQLPRHPRLGTKLDQYTAREVRRMITGQYEIRYELLQTTITVLRLWHTREER